MKRLLVHEDQRYLMWDDGTPFFYLADTAWEMLHGLTREEIDGYLSLRASQGFNVIQTVALAEFDGTGKTNAYGRLPLLQREGKYDPTQPDVGDGYDYWQHVDYAVDTAAEKGMMIVLLPTWGDKFHIKWGGGPEIFTPENARSYGRWIAARYAARWNIIWVLGGDRPLETELHREIIRAMGEGIREVDLAHLITFHPCGGMSSVDCVPDQEYIDFHMTQSGHGTQAYESWKLVRQTGLAEHKPFLDAENRYEDHPACMRSEYGYLWDAADVRQNAYWNLMEGVCGVAFGNHSVWKFHTQPEPHWPYTWQEALEHEGAAQMAYLEKLRLSRPYYEFRAAPELVLDDPAPMAHVAAGRGEKYAFIYSPFGLPVRAYLDRLGGSAVKASWFNPRTGECQPFAILPAAEAVLVPPSSGKGNDWVAVLDALN